MNPDVFMHSEVAFVFNKANKDRAVILLEEQDVPEFRKVYAMYHDLHKRSKGDRVSLIKECRFRITGLMTNADSCPLWVAVAIVDGDSPL